MWQLGNGKSTPFVNLSIYFFLWLLSPRISFLVRPHYERPVPFYEFSTPLPCTVVVHNVISVNVACPTMNVDRKTPFRENKSIYTSAIHTWQTLNRSGQITRLSRDDNRLKRVGTHKCRERCKISIVYGFKSGSSNKNNTHIVKVDRESLPTTLTFSSHGGWTKNGLNIDCVSRF